MTNPHTTTSQPKAQPVFRKQMRGGISAAVFENVTRDGRTYRSINLQRRYLRHGKWNGSSLYLDHEDIPFVIEALKGTWDYLNEYPLGAASPVDDGAAPVVFPEVPAETDA